MNTDKYLRYLAPEMSGTFHFAGRHFISRSAGLFISCPPSVIARVAERRVAPADLELPEGYTAETLKAIYMQCGWTDRDTRVSIRQAAELALIGVQLLELDEERRVEPPLNYYEQQSVAFLLSRVVAVNFNGVSSMDITPSDLAFMQATQQLVVQA